MKYSPKCQTNSLKMATITIFSNITSNYLVTIIKTAPCLFFTYLHTYVELCCSSMYIFETYYYKKIAKITDLLKRRNFECD